MKLEEVIRHCQIKELNLHTDLQTLEVKAIEQDSRKVMPGSLFVAIEGYHHDGHQKVMEALENGAFAVIVEKQPVNRKIPYILVADTKQALAEIAANFYKHPSEKMQVVGVTGTNGKTTVTHLISQLTHLLGAKTGLIGTMYNQIGERQVPAINTTPDSLSLQQLLSQMQQEEVTTVALEVSSHGLIQERTRDINFDVAVFTNLTQDHLDFHGSMEHYFEAKLRLFLQLQEESKKQNKLAVVNCDSEYGQRLQKLLDLPVLTYGCNGSGLLQATDIYVFENETYFSLCFKGKEYPVKTKLIGMFNVSNLLAAIGATLGLGHSIESIVPLIEELQPVKGRMQTVKNRKNITAIVDYAHTPDGLEQVLKTINSFQEGKLYCILGCGGDRDKTKRPKMAQIAMAYADLAILTSDNPRSERPVKIIADMLTDNQQDNYLVEVDRKQAILKALDLAEPGDIVLVAGKGHETYQIIENQKIAFDDRQVIRLYRPPIKMDLYKVHGCF